MFNQNEEIIKNSCNKLSDCYLSSEQAQRIFCKNFFFFFGESSSTVFFVKGKLIFTPKTQQRQNSV